MVRRGWLETQNLRHQTCQSRICREFVCTVNFEKHGSIRFCKVPTRVKPKRDLCTVPPKAGETSCSLYPSFPGGCGNSFWLGHPLLGPASGDGMPQAEGSSLFCLLCGSSQGFCCTVLLKFLKWTLDFPRAVLFMASCLTVDLVGGQEAGFSSITMFL